MMQRMARMRTYLDRNSLLQLPRLMPRMRIYDAAYGTYAHLDRNSLLGVTERKPGTYAHVWARMCT